MQGRGLFLLETRSLPIGFELKAVSGRTIEGYAAAWAKDRVGDIIDSKAFDRTIRTNPDVAVFVGHDASKLPVGEPVEMRADGHGLFTRTQIYDTPDGDALLAVAKARLSKGRTLGMSIGFKTVKDHWDAKQKARILEDLDLIEYSFLASPMLAANPQAYALGVKSLDGQTLEPVPDELQAEVRALIDAHELKSAQTMSADSAAPSTQAAVGGPHMSDLPDSAFAFIETGGVLDEERKTVPRSGRHFGHHDENGEVDVESIKAILVDSDLFKYGDLPVAHILRHAQAAGIYGRKIDKDDAHEEQWSKGLAARMLVREYKSGLLAEAIARNYLAYEDVGIDTKDGMHVSPKLQKQIADEQEVWVSLVTKANEIEQGIDGQALVDTWRTAFQLLDLEEVA